MIDQNNCKITLQVHKMIANFREHSIVIQTITKYLFTIFLLSKKKKNNNK